MSKQFSFSSPQEWLERYAIPVPEAGCWLFEKCMSKHGYGKVGFRGGLEIASRASYRMFYGGIPPGLFVCHTCDVRLCVNPKHLFLGTQKDNLQDMLRKGRSANKSKKFCNLGHPLEHFPRRRTHGRATLMGVCKICRSAYHRRRYQLIKTGVLK